MQRVPRLDEAVNHGPHTLIVLAEDGLEDGEVEVRHLEDNLVEDFDVFSSLRILIDVEERSLQAFHHHVVAINNLLRQNHQERVDLLVVGEPEVLKLEKLARQQILLVQFHSALGLLRAEGLTESYVFDLVTLSEVSAHIVVFDAESPGRLRFNHRHVILLRDSDFNSDSTL